MRLQLRPHLIPAAILTVLVIPLIVLEVSVWVTPMGPNAPIDYYLFGPSGAHLLRGQLGQVYADPRVQAGPFELVTYGVAYLLGVHTVVGWVAFFSVVSTLLTFAAIYVLSSLRGISPRTGRWYLALAVCALVAIASYIPSSVVLGHPADIAIPTLWLVAAGLARERFFVACGVVIALSAGWEVWGVLGAPVILLAAKPGLVRAALGGLTCVVLLFVPFIATGTFTMFSFGWPIATTSLFHTLAPHLASFPWTLRLLQALLAVVAGCVVALLTRGSRYGIWLVPLAIVAFRLVLDPVLAHYYWFAASLVAIGLLADLIQRQRWLMAFLAALLVAGLATPLTNFIGAIVFAVTVLALGVVVYIRRKPAALPA